MLHLLVALGSARVDVLLNQTENATASHGRERLSPAEQVGWTLFGLVLGGAFLINAALNYDPNYKIETTEYVEVDVDANEDSLDPFIAGTDTDSCSDAPYSSDSDNSCKPALRAPLLRRARGSRLRRPCRHRSHRSHRCRRQRAPWRVTPRRTTLALTYPPPVGWQHQLRPNRAHRPLQRWLLACQASLRPSQLSSGDSPACG